MSNNRRIKMSETATETKKSESKRERGTWAVEEQVPVDAWKPVKVEGVTDKKSALAAIAKLGRSGTFRVVLVKATVKCEVQQVQSVKVSAV